VHSSSRRPPIRIFREFSSGRPAKATDLPWPAASQRNPPTRCPVWCRATTPSTATQTINHPAAATLRLPSETSPSAI